MHTEILIVGGGISGLHSAYQLQKEGIPFRLIEARERLGGRILSKNYAVLDSESSNQYAADKPAYDLGPSWFWPGQTQMEKLINELGLNDSVFLQQGSGQAVYEDQQGTIQKGFYGISMEGAYRLKGGIRQIISTLKDHIDDENISLNSQVTHVEYLDNQIVTTFVDNANRKLSREENNEESSYQITSNKIVFALPPRIAMSAIEFTPPLSESRVTELNSYSTWMAGHAKFIAVYDSAFWLEQGLSGDAVSQLGPLREIHDASTDANSSKDNKECDKKSKTGYALFGFVGIPGSYRKGKHQEICQAAIDQLTRLFGDKAASPVDIVLQDWAQEAFTANDIDQSMSAGHATSSMSDYAESNFGRRLIWSGTESANHHLGHNGLLEGALEASKRTLKLLLK
ncbi:FAD-dependent oxidoreductase [Cocleimonas sp. KMM 6892]|uniref:flavin monoamine oxidase family protein n=1 Tax=unclassified Cocleimonas TaxID=2639732 RepID=UPI002DB96BE6|nr:MULTISPECIES: FAD-dependent oxidoreductase [unclassified Cocleimonas]MEB8433892.1 FAD-dependent oxidoreductase [Cocleimonas sp. KMM 6892]MEC4716703.1 FAD-dependent oxidoreductase [Cocleimonas sp. KMM 6895]MEC4746142.1 FAD-dependent oxidoreductase [Cocleimonas sp. KMM 6896]